MDIAQQRELQRAFIARQKELRRLAKAVVFGPEPRDIEDAYRWLDAALTWHGYTFEGDDSTGDPLTLVTGFHWDTNAEDITGLAPKRHRVYDRNCETACTLIDAVRDVYGVTMDVSECHDCHRIVQYDDVSGGWRHLDYTASACFLVPKLSGWTRD